MLLAMEQLRAKNETLKSDMYLAEFSRISYIVYGVYVVAREFEKELNGAFYYLRQHTKTDTTLPVYFHSFWYQGHNLFKNCY